MTEIQWDRFSTNAQIGWLGSPKASLSLHEYHPQFVPYLKTPFVPEGYTHLYQTYACWSILNDSIKSNEKETAYETLWWTIGQNDIATRQGNSCRTIIGIQIKRNTGIEYGFTVAYACDRLSIALRYMLNEWEIGLWIEKLAELERTLEYA
jgi:hypothetical protein